MIKCFEKYRDSKILIYGTGKIAARTLNDFNGFHIVYVADKDKKTGSFEGIPIVDIDSLDDTDIDLVIIASRPIYYSEITDRIIEKCFRNGWLLFGANGTNLSRKYKMDRRKPSYNKYFGQSEEQLKRIIDAHDIISFDVFDTLIMRKTLLCTDVLEIVDSRIKERGIVIDSFVSNRIAAEHELVGENIYAIYDLLEKRINLTPEQKRIICDTEIEVEKSCAIPRKAMASVFNYALESGKKVNIISDMYLPKEIIGNILQLNGIKGYDKLYVSCEYHTGKREELFDKYIVEQGEGRFLHIGDNENADYNSAKDKGMDAYLIKSAIDMLKLTNLQGIDSLCKSVNDRMILGNVLCTVLNSPFKLFGTCGVLKISSWMDYGRVIMAPVLAHYASSILEELYCNKYDGVMFTARDCWIIKKVLEAIKNRFSELPENLVYYYASRRVCLKTIIQNHEDVAILDNYVIEGNHKKLLTDFLSIDSDKICEKAIQETAKDYFETYVDLILDKTHKTRRGYQQYLEANGIRPEKRYLFCDLIAQGTTQYALNKMNVSNVEGLYYALFHGEHNYRLPIKAVFDEGDIDSCSIYYKDPLLEQLFTSFEPTVIDFNESGVPEFGEDERDCSYLEIIKRIQDGASEEAVAFLQELYIPGDIISNKLIERLFGMTDQYDYVDECEAIYGMCIEKDPRNKWVIKE